MNIGYIGLGLMGGPCARHLQKAGHRVYFWARNREKTRDFENEGMIWCDSPSSVAENVEMLFTNLTDTPDVESVLTGKNGVIDVNNGSGKPGLVIVDMSTISATATREMAKKLGAKGIELVDAPVSGGTQGAQSATLTIMVGASEVIFKKIKPVLECMGGKITRIGEVGAGQVAKSCNQIIITGSLMAVSEAFRLAESLDVDLSRVREALMGGFASGKILELHGQRMIDDNYAPGFKTSLHVKDMNIVLKMAEELGIRLPSSAAGLDLLGQTAENGYGELDSAAMYKVIKAL